MQIYSNKQMEFSIVFKELKNIMQPYEKNLDCKSDIPGDYQLDTKHIMTNKKPLYFGGIKTHKNYVSYHLMPVYVQPDLLKNISSELKKRMQGKSCFNFKTVDSQLFTELRDLTQLSYQYYNIEGYVKQAT